MSFKVWEEGFDNNNSNEIVAKKFVTTTYITHTFKANDARKMVKSQYEAIINLFLLALFVSFVAFLSHPTINKVQSINISLDCLDGFFEHGVHCLLLETKASMNFYNGQRLIRGLGEPWPNIKFEYVVCIFILLRSIVTLGIDDDYDMCRCSRCLLSKKKGVIGKKTSAHHIGL